VLLNVGRFRDAALAFEPLIPEVNKITNPDRRAAMFIHAARAQVFSGNPTKPNSCCTMHRAGAQYNLRSQESEALQALATSTSTVRHAERGQVYEEVLKITREQHNAGHQCRIAAAGYVARVDSDYARAIEMHRKAYDCDTRQSHVYARCGSSAWTIFSRAITRRPSSSFAKGWR
jgi:hypothetical protein